MLGSTAGGDSWFGYVAFAWGVALVIMAVAVLLHASVGSFAKASKATYWRSVGMICFAGLVAWAIEIAFAPDLWLLVERGRFRSQSAAVFGFLAFHVVCWVIVKALFKISFVRAFFVWLPVLGLHVALGVVFSPMLQQVYELSQRTVCLSNLSTVNLGIVVIKGENDGKWPEDMKSLIGISACSSGTLICPCVRDGLRPAGRTCDYFYFPPQSEDDPQTLVACDFARNHRDNSRSVLFADGYVKSLKHAEFQAELAKPVNAAFAKALRQAEGVPATGPAVYNTSGGPLVPAGTSRSANVYP